MNLKQIKQEITFLDNRIEDIKATIQDSAKEITSWENHIKYLSSNIEIFERNLSEIEQERRDLYKLKEKTILDGERK